MKKKEDKPIKIDAYNDLKDLIGYHPCQQITFKCEKCGKEITKSLSAVRKRGLLCQKCQREKNGIIRYGSQEGFKQHLKDVKKKGFLTLIEKYGSIEKVFQNRNEKYKETCLNKYGVDNTSKRQEFKDYLKNNNPMSKQENVEKAKASYNRDKHCIASKKVAKYMLDNNLYELNAKKCALTKLERYGNSGYTNHQKTEETLLAKYGVTSGFALSVKQKLDNIHQNGYITLQEVSDNYDYHIEGVACLLTELNIQIKIFGTWRCVLQTDIPNNFQQLIYKHRYCFSSFGEKEMFDFVYNLDNSAINNDRTILKPKELDIYVPNKNIAFEFDGLYWHQEQDLLCKTKLCAEQGIRLIHFYEDEWEYKKEICKSIIKASLGLFDNRIYARQCVVKEISTNEYTNFLNENHIQGNVNSPIKLGLYFQNELIQCIGVGKSRYAKNEYELYRMCTKLYCQVIGGFSKLLTYLKKHYDILVLYSYVDRRLFNGDGYKQIGFELIKETKPSYFYFKRLKRENRIKYQKHKLKDILENFNAELSEIENMKNNGFAIIYDCGTYKMKFNFYEI